MNTKFFTLLVSFFITISIFSQNSLNDYKYIIVPKKYDFLKEKDQYQLNSLTQFLFNKYGFEAYMEGEDYPQDLSMNRCSALTTDLLKDSGLFKTKLTIELKDCNGNTVFTSKIGESREKEYATAYNLALRDAFESVKAQNYKYEPKDKMVSKTTPIASSNKETAAEIEKLKKEIKTLKEEKQTDVVEIKKEVAETKPVVKEQVVPVNDDRINTDEPTVLYAQKIENGYQLVDMTPKVVYKIKKTGQENLFLVEGENAIIYKKGDAWFYEFNTDGGVMQKELNIKF